MKSPSLEEPLRARETFSNQTGLWIVHDLTEYQLGSVALSTFPTPPGPTRNNDLVYAS